MKPVLLVFKSLVLVIFIFCIQNCYAQNVGISSTSGFAPDASAALDVSFTNRGLLIPRIALTATNAAGPITSPATSLLVYNTATAGTSPTNVIPGYYFWNGSAWVALNTSVSGWSLTGNANVAPGTNFLGTVDLNSLRVKTNRLQRFMADSLGSVSVGLAPIFTSGVAREKFLVDAGQTAANPTPTGAFNVISGKGYLDNYLQLNIQNTANTAGASADIVASNDAATETANFIDMGINSSGNISNSTSGILGGPNLAYLYSTGNDFFVGNGAPNRGLAFFTSGTATTPTYTERMRIDASGNVGIGTASPTVKLSVAGIVAPTADATYNLGTSALRWNTVYYVAAAQTSDIRMKTNIKPLEYGLKEVLALNPVSYNWKKTPTTNPRIGLIAQEVQKIIPEVIAGDEKKETLGMNYAELVAVLINAIKEQQKQINELRLKIENTQKNKVLQLLHTGKAE